ncbi:hypothetical protein B0H14DRAFT_2621759 [Mycena olivaceomarginata]|nr:hypothetical protein B0H14DRAFT_2621759 [Mycena olivaceomarginata]
MYGIPIGTSMKSYSSSIPDLITVRIELTVNCFHGFYVYSLPDWLIDDRPGAGLRMGRSPAHPPFTDFLLSTSKNERPIEASWGCPRGDPEAAEGNLEVAKGDTGVAMGDPEVAKGDTKAPQRPLRGWGRLTRSVLIAQCTAMLRVGLTSERTHE